MFKNDIKKVMIFVSAVTLYSCSTLYSGFDGIRELWRSGEDIGEVEKPKSFAVTPVEVHGLVGPMKFAWRMYADNKNYYLSPLQNLVPKFGNNSHMAKEYDLKICGLKREAYENIKAKLGEGNTRPLQILRGIAKGAEC